MGWIADLPNEGFHSAQIVFIVFEVELDSVDLVLVGFLKGLPRTFGDRKRRQGEKQDAHRTE